MLTINDNIHIEEISQLNYQNIKNFYLIVLKLVKKQLIIKN